MQYEYEDIPEYPSWLAVSKVDKGWSEDKKYRIKTKDNKNLLLRIADISKLEAKKKEYEILGKYAKTGIHMSTPISFGICNNNQSVYMLLAWVEGEDLEEVLPKLSEQEQYFLGRQAGKILRTIHNIPVEEKDIPQQTKVEKKRAQLERYINSSVRVPNDQIAIDYLCEHIGMMWQQPPVYMHGDFHPGNLIYMPNGKIGVIDFNRWEVGDPYEEFYKLESFGIELSIPYCIGQIDAYFEDDIPLSFWETLAVYVAHASLYSIKWAEKFGQDEIDGMVRRWQQACESYDGFTRVIPKWYEDRTRKRIKV